MKALSAEGYKINRPLLATISPYITRHLNGDFVIDLQNIPQPLEGAMNLPIEITES